MSRYKKYIKRGLLTAAILFAIVTALVFSVYIPIVQHFIVSTIEDRVSESLDAEVHIGYFDLSFFADLNLENVKVVKQTDTLLSLERITIDVQFKPLIDHRIVIDEIQLTGLNTQLDKLIGYNDTTQVSEESVKDKDAAWELKLNHISIYNSVLALYDDELNMDLQIKVGIGEIGALSIDSFVYNAQDIRLEEARVSYVSPYSLEEDMDTSEIDFIFKTNRLIFINSEFYYNDSLMTFATGGKHLVADDLYVNIATEKVKIANVEADQSYFNLVYINDTLETPSSPILWEVSVDKANIARSQFVYDIPYLPENIEEFDYNHMHFTEMSVKAKGIFYAESQISLSLLSGSFDENKRVQIEQSSGHLYMDTEKIQLTNFKIKTSKSIIDIDGSLGYNVVDFDFRDNGELNMQMQYEADSWSNLDYFVTEYLAEIPNLDRVRDKHLKISSVVKGYYDSLYVGLDMDYDHSAKIVCSGNVQNATQESGLKYDLQIEKLDLKRSDIALFVADKNDLEYIPQQSSFEGVVKGTESITDINGLFISDFGSQNFDASIDLSDSIPFIKAKIDGSVIVNQYYGLHIDKIQFDGQLKGKDLPSYFAQMDAKLYGIQIDTLFYDSANVSVGFENEAYFVDIYSYDQHADFIVNSKGVINDSMLDSKSIIEVTNFSFKESGIFNSPENLQFKSKIAFRFNINNYHAILDVNVRDIALADSIEVNKIEKLNLTLNHTNRQTYFSFISDNNTIKANVDGSLDTLINNFEKFIDILVLEKEKTGDDSLSFPDVTVFADIKDPYEFLGNNINDSIPQFSSLLLSGRYMNSNTRFDLYLFIPELTYDGNVLDSTSFIIDGDLKGFDYSIESAVLLDSLLDIMIKVNGDFKDQKLRTHLNISDKNRVDFIDFEVLSQEADYGYMLNILGDTLTILSNRWHISQPNSLQLKKTDMVASGIELNRLDKIIQVKTNSEKKDISLILKNIELAVFNRVLSNDSLLAGYMNLDLTSSFQHDVTRIDLVANVDSFRHENHYLGDLKIVKAHVDAKEFAFDAGIKSVLGSTDIEGDIQLNGQKDLRINADLNSVDLFFLNTYLTEYLYNVSGNINAEIKISGTMDEPITNGFVQFDKANFGLKYLNEEFHFNNRKVLFTNNRVDPNDLMIFDRNNHKAFFNGDLVIYENKFKFEDFHIESDEMELMNSTVKDNEVLYGKVVSNFDIKLDGFLDDLNVKSKIELDYPTVVNYTFPDDLSVASNDGVVNFDMIDTLNMVDSVLIEELEKRSALLMNIFRYLDAELIVKDGCKFNIYFDNSHENHVNVMVNGDVKYLFSDETTQTTGLLNIKKGKMSYAMPMVSMKELNVSENSYIQITNDISNPFVSISATSKIWAQTGDLVENYNRNLEVTIFVYMQGTLDNLVVQFDVSSQTTDPLISSKISQMSDKERTMNAVNLLIRGQFASKQNTLAIDVNSYVNTLIADGLNKLISDRVKFVDMSFNIKSFSNIKSNGTIEKQSNLFFNVGKSFYHERIRINYRSNVTSNSTQKAGQYGSTDSYTESNFSIEYDITKNGNLQAVLFRKDSYEDILEGDVISTGGGFKIRKSYKSFGDIFKTKPTN